ncbi:MAG: hypothetical protein V1846_04960 [Candidatus Komeilibacteria bacterium]
MARRLVYYSSLVWVFLGFFATVSWWHWLFYIMAAEFILAVWLFHWFSRKAWRTDGWLWVSYSLLVVFAYPQFLQFADAETPAIAWLYAILVVFLWWWLLFSLAQYYSSSKIFSAQQYLEVNQFIQLVSFWQISNLLYFSLVNLNFPFWLALVINGLFTFLACWQLVKAHGQKKGSLWLILTAVTGTTVELFVAINLLPISYYMQSVLLTLWFFFVTFLTIMGQDLSSRRKLFLRTLILILVAAMVLVLTRL